ncbi:hypothetical protein TRAPUB_6224 [Trametes pubescens]|uniref:Uncharacterized protein n=1 Tax=Trametes pubescens TaxID=154538 RepID=A0A1M2V6Q5_TRAPU|nr:hypothetical protein TRAPUB_6224 [Trametes pubescens]
MVPSGDIVQRLTLATAFRDLKYSARRFSDTTISQLLHKPDGRLLNRIGAAALDALASLAVCAPNEAVALAAVLDRHSHIELCIAADTEEVPSTVVDHLNNICTRFLSIRATIEASPNKADILSTIRQDPHISKGSPEPALDALRLLELDLYTYSSARIRAGIADAPFDWLESLSHLVACLKGAPVDARDDLSDGERAALGRLQQSVRVQRYLPRFEREISYLQEFMRARPDDDVDAVRLRQNSVTLAIDSHLLEADMPQFDHFVSSHITRTTGAPPCEPPHTHEWMQKVAYVNTAFDALTRVLVTPGVSAMFGAHVPIHPVINIPPERLHAVALTADSIKATLATPLLYGWTASTFSPHDPAVFDDFVAELVAAEAGSGAFIVSARHIYVEH